MARKLLLILILIIFAAFGLAACTDLAYAKKEIREISVENFPKTVYYERNSLDLTGATIKVVYDDGSEEIVPITEAMISGYDKALLGEQLISVNYMGKVAALRVTVKELRLQSVEIVKGFALSGLTNVKFSVGSSALEGYVPNFPGIIFIVSGSFVENTALTVPGYADQKIAVRGTLSGQNVYIRAALTEGFSKNELTYIKFEYYFNHETGDSYFEYSDDVIRAPEGYDCYSVTGYALDGTDSFLAASGPASIGKQVANLNFSDVAKAYFGILDDGEVSVYKAYRISDLVYKEFAYGEGSASGYVGMSDMADFVLITSGEIEDGENVVVSGEDGEKTVVNSLISPEGYVYIPDALGVYNASELYRFAFEYYPSASGTERDSLELYDGSFAAGYAGKIIGYAGAPGGGIIVTSGLIRADTDIKLPGVQEKYASLVSPIGKYIYSPSMPVSLKAVFGRENGDDVEVLKAYDISSLILKNFGVGEGTAVGYVGVPDMLDNILVVSGTVEDGESVVLEGVPDPKTVVNARISGGYVYLPVILATYKKTDLTKLKLEYYSSAISRRFAISDGVTAGSTYQGLVEGYAGLPDAGDRIIVISGYAPLGRDIAAPSLPDEIVCLSSTSIGDSVCLSTVNIIEGSELMLEDYKLRIVFQEGQAALINIDPSMVGEYKSFTPGEHEVAVTYEGRSAILKINTVEKEVVGANVFEANKPDKKVYFVNQPFDPTGLEITLSFDNGTKKIIGYTSENRNDFVFFNTAFTFSRTAWRVSVTYLGIYEASFDVTVKDPASTGMTFIYQDGTGATVDGRPLTKGVMINGVRQPGTPISDIVEGDEIDWSTGTAMVFYEYGPSKIVRLDEPSVNKSAYSTATFGNKDIRVSYKSVGWYATLSINVRKKAALSLILTNKNTVAGNTYIEGDRIIEDHIKYNVLFDNGTYLFHAVGDEFSPAPELGWDYVNRNMLSSDSNMTATYTDGSQTITYIYEAASESLTFTVLPLTAERTSITPPRKIYYLTGTYIGDIDLSGDLYVEYIDNRAETISLSDVNVEINYYLDGLHITEYFPTEGDCEAVVSYGGQAVSFFLYIRNVIPVQVDLLGAPAINEFISYGDIPFADMSLKVTYSDASVETVGFDTDYLYYPDTTALGLRQLIIVYKGVICLYTVNIVGRRVVSLELKKPPKLVYALGEENTLDISGLVIIKKYNDSSESEVREFPASLWSFQIKNLNGTPGDLNTAGKKKLIITGAFRLVSVPRGRYRSRGRLLDNLRRRPISDARRALRLVDLQDALRQPRRRSQHYGAENHRPLRGHGGDVGHRSIAGLHRLQQAVRRLPVGISRRRRAALL